MANSIFILFQIATKLGTVTSLLWLQTEMGQLLILKITQKSVLLQIEFISVLPVGVTSRQLL